MTNRPPTDRERALAAEARVAELELELAEYRRAEAGELDQTYFANLGRVRQWLRVANLGDRRASRGFAPAALLLALLAASPRIMTRPALVEAMRRARVGIDGLALGREGPDDKVVDVVVVSVRRAVATVPASVLTWRAIGFSIATPDAAAIRAAIGLDA